MTNVINNKCTLFCKLVSICAVANYKNNRKKSKVYLIPLCLVPHADAINLIKYFNFLVLTKNPNCQNS